MRFSSMLAGCALMAMLGTSVPAAADVKKGYDAWQRGDFAAAVAEWRPLAIAGDPMAQYNMGLAYKLGRGVERDLDQAIAWYKRAADQGHIEAFDSLGILLFNMNRRTDALPYILKSAERGESRAQYILGTACFNGDLVTKDWPRAYALMNRASAKGLTAASSRLAELDKLIPLDQRQKGLAMAAEMERDEGRVQLASLPTPGESVAAVGTSRPNPSRPVASNTGAGATYTPPPLSGTPTAAPATVKPKPAVKTASRPPASERPVPEKSAPAKPAAAKPTPAKPAPKPAPPKAAPAPSVSGPWTAQLGAFSSQSNAASLWSRLSGRAPFSGYSPRYAKAGAIIRLQVGGFASRDAAARFCQSAARSGQSCIPAQR